MSTTPEAMPPAKAPVGTGSAPLIAQLIGLALIGVGVVAVQNVLAVQGAVSGSPWLSAVADAADGLEGRSAAVLTVGVVAVVLGVLLLPVVFRPRPRTGLALTSATGVHVGPKDVSRVVKSAVVDVDSLSAVSVTSTRRRVRVRATTVATKDRATEVRDAVRTVVEPALAALEKPPRLSISLDHDND